MGKQSARMYFGQKDHSDLYFADEYEFFHNHFKIYKGKNLLWKRGKPGFVFAGGFGFMATSEDLKTFSSFPFPQSNIVPLEKYKNEPVARTTGLEYAFGKYFMSQQIIKRTYETNRWEIITNHLIYSENGYEWKILIESDEYISGLGKINEKIVFGTGDNTFWFGSDLKIEKIYDGRMNVLAAGNGITFIRTANASDIYILKNGNFERMPINGSGTYIRYNKSDGYFYFFIERYSGFTNNDIVLNKTKDGVSFEYLTEIKSDDIDNYGVSLSNIIFFIDGNIHLAVIGQRTLNGNDNLHMVRVGSGGYVVGHIGTYTKYSRINLMYCIGNVLYYSKTDYQGDNYEIEQITYYRMPLNEVYSCRSFAEMANAGEKLKFTDRIYNWYYDYSNHPSLDYAVCTDENIIIQN